MTTPRRTQQALGWIRARVAWAGERGASAVEYGLIAALIAAVIVLSAFFLGQETTGNFDCTADSITVSNYQC